MLKPNIQRFWWIVVTLPIWIWMVSYTMRCVCVSSKQTLYMGPISVHAWAFVCALWAFCSRSSRKCCFGPQWNALSSASCGKSFTLVCILTMWQCSLVRLVIYYVCIYRIFTPHYHIHIICEFLRTLHMHSRTHKWAWAALLPSRSDSYVVENGKAQVYVVYQMTFGPR